jgi:Zn-finger nucleic acid-binding protein
MSESEDELSGPSQPCPVCGEPMVKQRMIAGIIADICQQHGIWLDKGKLPAIIHRARGYNQSELRRRLRKAKSDGRADALGMGLSSLLPD